MRGIWKTPTRGGALMNVCMSSDDLWWPDEMEEKWMALFLFDFDSETNACAISSIPYQFCEIVLGKAIADEVFSDEFRKTRFLAEVEFQKWCTENFWKPEYTDQSQRSLSYDDGTETDGWDIFEKGMRDFFATKLPQLLEENYVDTQWLRYQKGDYVLPPTN